jgi:hypothetical protein
MAFGGRTWTILKPFQKLKPAGGFFCYGLAWGIRHGLLERNAYLLPVARAWDGLSRNISPDGRPLRGQQVDFQPNAVHQESTPEFVTGAFLLAGSQVYALSPQRNSHAASAWRSKSIVAGRPAE